MALKGQPSKDDCYAPAVPSPLNPTGCDQVQVKQHHQRVKIVGRSSSRQSPTEILLRYKAALAFHDHARACGTARELPEPQARQTDEGDLGTGRNSGNAINTPTSPVDPHREKPASEVRSPSRYSPVPRAADVWDLVMRSGGSGPITARDSGAGEQEAICATTSFTTGSIRASTTTIDRACNEEKTRPLPENGSREFLVDLSSVTIDNLATAVLVKQRRTLLAWATPNRMHWVFAIGSFLLILVFIRLQALCAWFMS